MKICPFRVMGAIQNLDVVIYPPARIYRKFTSDTPYFFKKMSVKGERGNNFAALVDKPAPICPL